MILLCFLASLTLAPDLVCDMDQNFCNDWACCWKCWNQEMERWEMWCWTKEVLSRDYHRNLLRKRWKY